MTHIETGATHGARIDSFGHSPTGAQVDRITLISGDLRVEVLTWGAVVHRLWLKDVDYPLSQGGDTMADYLGAFRYHGALIAPVANRLSGAAAPIAGRLHQFEANENGKTSLHSGSTGAHARLWSILSAGPDEVTLALELADGEGGFPGARQITARFSLPGPGTLRLQVDAHTDLPTLMNIANHSYWNLDGGATWEGHSLRLAAEHYLPTGPDTCPTGELRAVAGGSHDFRIARKLHPGMPALDHAFILSTEPQPMREVLWLAGLSGVTLALATTERSVQVYDGRRAPGPGAQGYQSLAIEAQGWPDSPNQAGFPSIEINAGTPYRQVTEWRIRRKK